MKAKSLNPHLLRKMDAYWRAANYLSVGQIYLYDNPLLKKPLKLAHIKPRQLGHWGTTPGLNFIYVHLNRVIEERDLNIIYITGPCHGGPGIVANTYPEGTYSEVYPNISQDEAGMKRLFKQFSFPGGIPSHVAPETPGSIHEGGELGYSFSHVFGTAFDNPDLLDRFCVAVHIDRVHPDAIRQLPVDIQQAAERTALIDNQDRRISVRAWYAFAQLRQRLQQTHGQTEAQLLAATAVFNQRAQDTLDALSIANSEAG